VRRQKKVLRRWLRQAKKLNYTKEKMVYVSEPKSGESLGDEEERSLKISWIYRREMRRDYLKI
jgi:hypothetical protein